MKRLSFLTGFVWLVTTVSFAQKSEIFIKSDAAINGYDAVAYFTQSKPVKGSTQHIFSWKGASWLFSTKQNLEAFKANPEKYAPQYGGYCAYGLSRGYKAPTEADAWSIVNGKLYLNYNKDVRDIWNKGQSGYIKKADDNWPGVKNKS
ncbi:MAG: YHS domain-containing (seleno)protein [Chitinophagaceae bacterium]|nr:YHS domain-containing (seleno)protein [Chitinophagaceae bacterium]